MKKKLEKAISFSLKRIYCITYFKIGENFCHTKKEGKKEIRKRNFIQFSLHITLKRNIGRYIRKYMYIFTIYKKKAVISKDIKVECKSNLLKKKRGIQHVFIYSK